MKYARSRWPGTLVGLGTLVACSEPSDLFTSGGGAGALGGGNHAAGALPGGSAGTASSGTAGASSGLGGSAPSPSAGDSGASAGTDSSNGDGGKTSRGGKGGSAPGTPAGEGGADAGSSGTDGSAAGSVGNARGACPGLPAVTDYAKEGPFDVTVVPNTGPDGTYYLFRPDTTLGKDGFLHPIAVWGNGILTTPDQYRTLLSHVASHGIVLIACPSTQPERPCLDSGMEWLVEQNSVEGALKGKLDTSKEITIGYSWGGGAAIDTANRPQVKATISLHGMPPREANAWADMKAPLLLFTSTGDTFVSAQEYVTPNYESSLVPTFYATLEEQVGHLYPLDETAVSCAAGVLLGGPCAAAAKEQAPIVAWIRLWACGDTAAKRYFYGADCELCKSPWRSRTKPAGAF